MLFLSHQQPFTQNCDNLSWERFNKYSNQRKTEICKNISRKGGQNLFLNEKEEQTL